MVQSNALIKMVEDSGLPQTKSQQILDQFTEYFQIAAKWENKALTIVVTDASQTGLIAQARAAWLELRSKRIALEETRKELKRDAFNEGKCIDNIANVLKSLFETPEKHLEKQAKFVEFKQKAIEAERRKKADELLRKEEEAERKVIDEQFKKDRLENERLIKEASEKERIHREELVQKQIEADEIHRKAGEKAAAVKKKADDKLKELEDKAKAVNQRLIDAARVAREKDAAKLQKQKDKAAAEQKKRDDAARAERKRLEAEKKKAEAEKRAAMSNYEKLLGFVRGIEEEDFTCGHCEGQCSDADSRAADILQEIGEE